jgi:sugar phosphate permease
MKKESLFKSVRAVVCGIAATAAAAAALYPVIDFIMDWYFHLFSGNKYPDHDGLRVMIGFYTWFALPALTGGYVSAWLAPYKKMMHTVICCVICLVTIFVLTGGFHSSPSKKDVQEMTPLFMTSVLFFMAGGFARWQPAKKEVPQR